MKNLIADESTSFLANTQLGQSLDANELEMIFTHNNIVSYSPGGIILKQGKKANGIYLIIQGEVISKAKIFGENIINREPLGPGSFIGDNSYIEKISCPTSMVAKTYVSCLFINHMYFELISTYFPETKYKLFYAVASQACDRLKMLSEKINSVISDSDMITRSFFGEFIQSFSKPESITFSEAGIHFDHLSQWPLLNKLSQNEVDEFFKHVISIKVPKNCILLNKDDQQNICYIVIHGAVQSSIIQKNKKAKLSVIGPVTLFTWPASFKPDLHFNNISYSTCESAVLLMIDKEAILVFQKECPSLWYKLFDHICWSLLALEKSLDKLNIRLQIETYNR